MKKEPENKIKEIRKELIECLQKNQGKEKMDLGISSELFDKIIFDHEIIAFAFKLVKKLNNKY